MSVKVVHNGTTVFFIGDGDRNYTTTHTIDTYADLDAARVARGALANYAIAASRYMAQVGYIFDDHDSGGGGSSSSTSTISFIATDPGTTLGNANLGNVAVVDMDGRSANQEITLPSGSSGDAFGVKIVNPTGDYYLDVVLQSSHTLDENGTGYRLRQDGDTVWFVKSSDNDWFVSYSHLNDPATAVGATLQSAGSSSIIIAATPPTASITFDSGNYAETVEVNGSGSSYNPPASSLTNFAWVVKNPSNAVVSSINGAPATGASGTAVAGGTYESPHWTIDTGTHGVGLYTFELTVTDNLVQVSSTTSVTRNVGMPDVVTFGMTLQGPGSVSPAISRVSGSSHDPYWTFTDDQNSEFHTHTGTSPSTTLPAGVTTVTVTLSRTETTRFRLYNDRVLSFDTGDVVGNFDAVTRIELYGSNQFYTDLDLTGMAGLEDLLVYESSVQTINLTNCTALDRIDGQNTETLQSINFTGCTALDDLDLRNGNMTAAQVDAILDDVEAIGSSNGTLLDLTGAGNAAPTAAGVADANALSGRSWNVSTN